MVGNEDNIQGDFDGLVHINFDSPCSFSWFSEVWDNYAPKLITESDHPQCVECFELTSQHREALHRKDNVGAINILEKKNKHIENAHKVFEVSKLAHAHAAIYAEEAAIVVDNMASKSIPKFKKEKSDSWSKDKLTLHIGGTHFDHSGDIKYYIYPELISESANTITSQLADSLLILKNSKPSLKVVTITFDNHSTQKNYTVIGYLEWQIKAGYIPPDGYFHVIYLVCGHTHSHLDAANKSPRMQYYKAKAIESPSEMV